MDGSNGEIRILRGVFIPALLSLYEENKRGVDVTFPVWCALPYTRWYMALLC
jgi:hypothetical protein